MTVDLPFLPIYDAHAIAEAAVFFQFEETFTDEEWVRLRNLKNELKEEFADSKDINHVSINIEANSLHTLSNSTSGFELRKNDTITGKTLWCIRVDMSNLSFHCLDYTRWIAVFSEMKRLAFIVMSKFNVSKQNLKSIGLKNIDQFIYNGTDEAFEIKNLFNDNTSYLPIQVFKQGAIWHNHSGWFGKDVQQNFIVNNLNITLGKGIIDKKPQHVTSIDHTITLNLNEEQKNNIITNKEFDIYFNKMHQENKQILGGLLNEKMKKRINLVLEDKK